MYTMREIAGVLHCVRDQKLFDKNGSIKLDDTPLVLHLEIEADGVVSIREQMERLYARERAAIQAASAPDESEEDENDFDLDDHRYMGTSSNELRERAQSFIELAEKLEASREPDPAPAAAPAPTAAPAPAPATS